MRILMITRCHMNNLIWSKKNMNNLIYLYILFGFFLSIRNVLLIRELGMLETTNTR